MRALFAGVSGLRNHQTRMDVIGNNIANVNTLAFKSSRVTFEEAFAQLVRGASRPQGGAGGVNPVQIGLGMSIGSVDQDFSQGNLESTGQATDLAIQGDAFFIVGDGTASFFTRAGNFNLDADGRLVLPNNGYGVQGVMADPNGVLPTGTALSDIILPLTDVSPAQATTEVSLAGNLDTRREPLGTVLRTAGRVYAIEQSSSNGGLGSDVNGLYANGIANDQILGLNDGQTTVTFSDGTTTQTYTYVSNDTGVGDLAFNSFNDLIAEINNDFATVTASLNNTTGAVELTGVAASSTITFTASTTALRTALASAEGVLLGGATATTDEFSHVASASDLLVNLRDGSGADLGLVGGETLLFDADIGGTAVTQGSLVVAAGSTTYQDLLAIADGTLGLTNPLASAIDPTTGALRVTGDGGTANEITGLNIRASGGVAGFDAVFDSRPGNYVEEQIAADVEHEVAITVFDSLGAPHVLTIRFTKDATAPNRWSWEALVPPPAIVTGGGTGFVTFDADGRLETFSHDTGASSLQFDPNNGASAPVDLMINAGTFGNVDGLSQFAGPSTAIAESQDGFSMGNLLGFTVDERGVITGSFTNGTTRSLAQIAVAAFANPTGLITRGDAMYAESANSGNPIVGFVGTTNQSQITPGALESSNVDLSEEFTNMIIAQRGFQANARVITTADEMLTELVNLKR